MNTPNLLGEQPTGLFDELVGHGFGTCWVGPGRISASFSYQPEPGASARGFIRRVTLEMLDGDTIELRVHHHRVVQIEVTRSR